MTYRVLMLARWHFGIGDPNAVAWVIVGGYLVSAVLAGIACMAARSRESALRLTKPMEARDQRTMKRVWLFVTVTMVTLGINKQLDLQTLLIEIARRRARASGWYDRRRQYQEEFIAVVGLLGIIGTALLAFSLRRVFKRMWLTIVGMCALVAFVLIRAASFHYVDRFLALGGTIHVNWVLELGSLTVIIASVLIWQYGERNRAGFLRPESGADRGMSVDVDETANVAV